MCHFDQICTNNLSPYSETGKEGKREPGPEGKWKAESSGFGLHDDNVQLLEHVYMPCSVLSILHVSSHLLLADPGTVAVLIYAQGDRGSEKSSCPRLLRAGLEPLEARGAWVAQRLSICLRLRA